MITSTVHIFLALGIAAGLFYGGVFLILACTVIGTVSGRTERSRR